MEVATKISESWLVVRSGVMNVSREWSHEHESQMGVASGIAKCGLQMWAANMSRRMGCECESQNGVTKIKNSGRM